MEPEVEAFTIVFYGVDSSKANVSSATTIEVVDEDTITVALGGDITLDEDSGEYRVCARVIQGLMESSSQLRIRFGSIEGGATKGADLAFENTRVSFGQHDTEQCMTFNILEDQIDEPDGIF